MADGTRKITHIMEVTGFDGDKIILQPIFEFQRRGYDQKGMIVGEFRSTGYIPRFFREAKDQGVEVDFSLFGSEDSQSEAEAAWT